MGNLSHPAEVDLPRIGTVAGKEDQRTDFLCLTLYRIIVQQAALLVDGVAIGIEHLGGDILAVSMGQVAATVVVQPQDPLVARLCTDHVPLLPAQLAGIGGAQLLQGRHQHLGVEYCPIGAQVRIGAAMGLHIRVLRTKELACHVTGIRLDGIDVVTPGIEPVVGEPLAVLVGQEVAHGKLCGQAAEVLAGDELEVRPLVGKLLHDMSCYLGCDLGDLLQGSHVGYHACVGCRMCLKICLQCCVLCHV